MFKGLLIANRGEIAVRIARTVRDLGIRTVAVFSDDDALSLHVRKTDDARALGAKGAAAYLDIDRLIAIARETGCDALHPGYGFLSENAALSRRCAAEGIVFVGPAPEALELFGDKAAARAFAAAHDVPTIPGTSAATSLNDAAAFMATHGPIMVKAIAGGGGRGMRLVRDAGDLADAYGRAASEAKAAFGSGDLYVERLIERARHIEVQVVGEASGEVRHLFERDCTLQRRNQKIVEIAPAPTLDQELRQRVLDYAVRLARAAGYRNLGTFEFLIDEASGDISFIEANPRLQVEHTVTEMVMGVDLVRAQLLIAAGEPTDLPVRAAPQGVAVQLRVNMETMTADGAASPTGGVLTAFDLPAGPGVRVDTFGYAGYRTNAAFDSLLAKVIVEGATYEEALRKAGRALAEFRIEGVETNIGFLQALIDHPAVATNAVSTRFIEDHAAELIAAAPARELYFASTPDSRPQQCARVEGPAGSDAVRAPLQGTIVSIDVAAGDLVRAGQQVAVLEAMKMEHLVVAPVAGTVRLVAGAVGETLSKDDAILFVHPGEGADIAEEADAAVDLDAIRPDLAELRRRKAFLADENRPKAVERRRKTNQRTARENIAALVDDGSFNEYGGFAIAAQRARRSLDDLIENTPADGVVVGTGSINGEHFGADKARCAIVAYDYTVLAGTQGQRNHKKQDRLFKVAAEWRLPVVLFAEGGGGRPGETDRIGITGLDVPTFAQFAKLGSHAPLVGVVSGYCFAGNAALLGCCHVIIATKNASLGMGGPAMIEGGGLGVYHPDEVGPVSMQSPNGVIDIVCEDEVEAVEVARKYLSYFQGPIADWACADQRALRRAIPENRLRVYEIRDLIDALADTGSVLELRREFGVGMVTAFIRIEGRPFGLIANNPKHLGGAIDSEAADKAARFIQLCDAFDIPLVSLCDTPGFMVGPEYEKTALVRHVSRMFVTAANISTAYFTVVLRKGYGLGAQAMAAGSFHASVFTVAWPTGEFGGMGIEGLVRLGYRKEMEAIADPEERQAYFKAMVDSFYDKGKAISIASVLEIDEVIDPVETRAWIIRGLNATGPRKPGPAGKRGFVDTW